MIRFVDFKPDKETNGPFTAKEASFPNGIYNSMSLLRQLISRKNVESYFYFEQQRTSDSKVYISINCDEKCKMLHHINFSDNLLQMLGFLAAISSKHQFFSKLAIGKPNSNETEEKTFLTHGFKNKKMGQRHTISYWSSELYNLWRAIPDKMFVYYDICAPYIISDVRTPLLRIVPIEIRSHNYAFGANLVKYFSFPNYIPLQRTNFRTIKIDMRSS